MAGLQGGIVPQWLRTLVCPAGLVVVEVVDGSLDWAEVGPFVAAEGVSQCVGFVGGEDGPYFGGVGRRERAVVFVERMDLGVGIACSVSLMLFSRAI